MVCAEEISIKEQVNYRWKIIRKNGGDFFSFVFLWFLFCVCFCFALCVCVFALCVCVCVLFCLLFLLSTFFFIVVVFLEPYFEFFKILCNRFWKSQFVQDLVRRALTCKTTKHRFFTNCHTLICNVALRDTGSYFG